MSLTIDDALARAESVSPLVRRARAELEVAASARVGAAVISPFNPALSVGGGYRHDGSASVPAAQGGEWALRLEQPVEVARQRGARLHEAAQLAEVAESRTRFARAETRARVRSAYVAALIAGAQLEAARRQEALGEQLHASAEARNRAGASSDVELRLAEAERGRLVTARLEAELSFELAKSALRRVLQLGEAQPYTLATPLARPRAHDQPLPALIASARQHRADLQALARTGALLDAAIVRLRREAVPTPTVFIEAGQAQPGQTWAGAGVVVPLPLWQHNQGAVATARAERERAVVELELADVEVAREVFEQQRAEAAQAGALDVWDRQIVPAAEATVELASEGWRAGKHDLLRVIQLARESAEARRAQLVVLGRLWEASIALDRAVGAP